MYLGTDFQYVTVCHSVAGGMLGADSDTVGTWMKP